ncbi:hypothetical protein A2671_02395 [Candidatus Kaiserbacteria bacterium RIFCSPHIGHO2_01_FULL_49_13]|uniref:Uncharacterized protein n=1 Tax=Candidatus Kaiserbacteria bacterium RIFCSPHIGHO2_01_FULL_49_13 TaxID=1798477 RepID=A0A1F6CCM7_9BACT|nr:MAG: hypothetical protein A2671_02395 [Candidatus Kaiserbacteria bacterium RIFCSPHIGHO2_01_FULL_49_13]
MVKETELRFNWNSVKKIYKRKGTAGGVPARANNNFINGQQLPVWETGANRENVKGPHSTEVVLGARVVRRPFFRPKRVPVSCGFAAIFDRLARPD